MKYIIENKNLMEEWDWEKNNQLKLYPDCITYGSEKKAWWICSNNHEWYARIGSRSQGCGCPECNKERRSSAAERKVYYYMKKYFDNSIWTYKDETLGAKELDIYIPELDIAIEYDGEDWHQDIQKDLEKDKLCDHLHIKLIRIRQPKCPKYESTCKFLYLQDKTDTTLANVIRMLLIDFGVRDPQVDLNADMGEIESLTEHLKHGVNSFESKFPDIAKEWHPTKNGKLKPNNITAYSNKKVWWKCSKCGNEWMAVCSDRALGHGCKECSYEAQKKLVYCIELDKIFSSISEVCNKNGLLRSGIIKSCKDQQYSTGRHPQTGEKLHWLYVQDQKQKDGSIVYGAITLRYITQEQLDNYLQKCN
jgi:very-short-patch-repair endonuclease